MIEHPDKCPECGSDEVTYERFDPEYLHGVFICWDCEWMEPKESSVYED